MHSHDDYIIQINCYMKKGLFALALGTFTLGMTEFIIEGILTDVAHDMNVSIPVAGHLDSQGR